MASQLPDPIGIREEEEGKETGGRFRAVPMTLAVGADAGDYDDTFSYPIPRCLMSAEVDVHADWVGDSVSLLVAPDTIIGTLTSESAAAATVHDVAQTVIDNIFLGAMVKIGTEDLGECIAIDTDNLKITTSVALVASAASGSLVKMTVCMADHVPMTSVVPKIIGESKIGGSYLPANTAIKLIYHRSTAGSAFTYAMTMEHLY